MSAFQTERSWLREASLKRVNTMLINKRELPEHASILRDDISLKDVDPSGLSGVERYHIGQWAAGQESGRHCMLALLEHRRIQRHTKNMADMDAQVSDNNNVDTADGSTSLTLGMIGRSINLPSQVFADSGELHEGLFDKSPNAVLKQTLQMLASVAMEKGALSLNAEQLNLALKQLRIQAIGTIDGLSGKDLGADIKATSADEKGPGNGDENIENSSAENSSSDSIRRSFGPSCRNGKNNKKTHSMEAYRLQIVQELIRLYVKHLGASKGEKEDISIETEGEDDIINDSLTHSKAEDDLLKHHTTLERHLCVSLDQVAQHIETEDVEDIEKENSILLSYIRQITAMKGSLETQLKDFESSRAFLSLGLSKDATTEQIRKAYHAKAVKLHPDKRGGSTELFQKLQVQYQEIVKQRELEESCRDKKFPEAEEHARLAQETIAEMELHLRDIKTAAENCGTLGQLNMRWVKKLESYAEMLFPKNITKMMKYILKNLESKSGVSSASDQNVIQTDLSVQSCSARHLIIHINLICDNLQKLLAGGVSLVSLGRYGREASRKKSFLQLLEQAVACGLSVSEHIKDIENVESQVIGCVERFLDVQETLLMGNEKLVSYSTATVLSEMALTVFRSRSITVNMIAEIAVLAAVLAADLCSQAQELVEKVDMELREEIRKASHDAAVDMEHDYCEEDLENLAKVKAQRMKEDREEDALRCKAQELRRQEEKKQEAEAENVMEHLSNKIRQLHVQLKLQYVQTLQKINSDAWQYQKKLLQPLLNEFGAFDSSSDERHGHHQRVQNYNGAEEKDRVRVLSLLADFIDRSCLRFRDSLLAQREADALHLIRTEVGVEDEKYQKSTFWDLLNTHLGWMTVLDRSHVSGTTSQDVKAGEENTMSDVPVADSNVSDNEEKTENLVAGEKKLVFYPDYRSRVLYLSVLLDAGTVSAIVESELKDRLKEILGPANASRQPEHLRIQLSKEALLTASLFCALVVQGISAARNGMICCV